MIPATVFCDTCGAANRGQAQFCAVCGRPLQTGFHTPNNHSLTGLLSQQHILKQRYRILGQLGKGGFGAVYRAVDTHFGNRPVAIKEMSQSGLNPQELHEATEAFKREAMLLAGLTHPNLPRIYDQFNDAGRWYLVMDFIEGQTLEEYVSHRGFPGQGTPKLPLETILDIGLQLCSVLEYLHTRQPPIIFRDLKPANIMLATNGHLYLIDFGIARHFKPGQSRDTTALGSSGYAAPEQYGRTQTTPRADIYSLGATLHELLTGHDPSDTPFHFAPIATQNNPVLVLLAQLVQQMLEMDVNKRPPSAGVVRQELQRIASMHTSATTNPLRPVSAPIYQPVSTSMIPTMPPLSTLPRSSSRQTAPPQPQRNTLFICSGHSSRVTSVSWSPDGKKLASGGYDRTVRLWDATNGNSIHTYRGHGDRVNAVAWSPNGTLLASASDDFTVRIWDTTTGKCIFTYNGQKDRINAIAWSPDGTRIASASNDKTVHVWEVATGRMVLPAHVHTEAVLAVTWSPDGRRIASAGDDKVVDVWDIVRDTRSSFLSSLFFPNRGQITYRNHVGRVNALAWSPDGRRIASVSSDKSMQVWDAQSGKLTFVHRNRSYALNAVAWSPDSRRLVSGSNDKTAQVWDAITRNALSTYHGHNGYVTWVAWAPDGTSIASASVDKTIQIWKPL